MDGFFQVTQYNNISTSGCSCGQTSQNSSHSTLTFFFHLTLVVVCAEVCDCVSVCVYKPSIRSEQQCLPPVSYRWLVKAKWQYHGFVWWPMVHVRVCLSIECETGREWEMMKMKADCALKVQEVSGKSSKVICSSAGTLFSSFGFTNYQTLSLSVSLRETLWASQKLSSENSEIVLFLYYISVVRFRCQINLVQFSLVFADKLTGMKVILLSSTFISSL